MSAHRTRNVYLAGNMSQLTLAQAKGGWRADFARALSRRKTAGHVTLSSPCRSEPRGFKGVMATNGAGMPETVLTRNARAVMAKDRADIDNCDLFVACYLDSRGVLSLGTAWEVGFAHARGKPILVIGDKNDVNVSHLLISGSADFHASTIPEAVRATCLLLTPGL